MKIWFSVFSLIIYQSCINGKNLKFYWNIHHEIELWINVDNIQSIITVLIFKKKIPWGLKLTIRRWQSYVTHNYVCNQDYAYTMLKAVVNFTAYLKKKGVTI